MANYLVAAKDGGGKKKVKDGKATKTQYKIYSGNVDEEGKTIENPTETQAITTMAKYMKKNNPESNVYRPNFSHLGVAYDRKKKSKIA